MEEDGRDVCGRVKVICLHIFKHSVMCTFHPNNVNNCSSLHTGQSWRIFSNCIEVMPAAYTTNGVNVLPCCR